MSLQSDVVFKDVVFYESAGSTELEVIVQVRVAHLVSDVECVACKVSHIPIEYVVLHDDVRESLVKACLEVSSPVAGCAILKGPSRFVLELEVGHRSLKVRDLNVDDSTDCAHVLREVVGNEDHWTFVC